MTAPLRVVLADDHQMVLEGLAAMLGHFTDEVLVVATTTSAAQARALIAEHRPQVLVCDVRLGAESGLDLTRQVRADWPEVQVLLLTVYDDEHYLYQGLRAGASGYVLKRVGARELVDMLLRVAAGEVVVDPAMAGRVALSAARMQAGEFWPGAHLGLTQREAEVLELVVAGLANRAIAQRLTVSEDTVKTHVRSLYRKLEVTDRAGAVRVALREGLFR
ncbi:MAG: response regulator transcription factor [Cellulomonas sp.]|nr:response regulator transcription factor [Cellulomonas sp.]